MGLRSRAWGLRSRAWGLRSRAWGLRAQGFAGTKGWQRLGGWGWVVDGRYLRLELELVVELLLLQLLPRPRISGHDVATIAAVEQKTKRPQRFSASNLCFFLDTSK